MNELIGIASNLRFVMAAKEESEDIVSLIPIVELVFNTSETEYSFGKSENGRTPIEKVLTIKTTRFSVNEKSIREMIERLQAMEEEMADIAEKFDQQVPLIELEG